MRVNCSTSCSISSSMLYGSSISLCSSSITALQLPNSMSILTSGIFFIETGSCWLWIGKSGRKSRNRLSPHPSPLMGLNGVLIFFIRFSFSCRMPNTCLLSASVSLAVTCLGIAVRLNIPTTDQVHSNRCGLQQPCKGRRFQHRYIGEWWDCILPYSLHREQ